MKVVLVHVPYVHRGGEDVHVDVLEKAYARLGAEVRLFPQRPVNYGLGNVFSSLSNPKNIFDFSWVDQTPEVFFHLHNIFPILGPAFLEALLERKRKVVMTVHNHRFFCTNGLALREGRICKDCFSEPSLLRPILRNCNSDLQKSSYYSIAVKKIREKRLTDAVTRWIAPSPYIREELIRFGVDRDSVRDLINPVAFDSLVEALPKGPELDFFYAGRASQEKGIDTILGLAQALPEYRFGIAGSGPLEARIKDAAQKFGNLVYFGTLTHSEVRQKTTLSRATLLPSICNEILPSFALESFVLGKRCIVPNLDSTKWLAQKPFYGILADTSNFENMKQAVKTVLSLGPVDPLETSSLQKFLSFERFSSELARVVQ